MKKMKFLLIGILCSMGFIANAQDPTVSASNVSITGRGANTLGVSWTRGNGDKCLVVCKPFSNSYSYPQDGQGNDYVHNIAYGSGDNLGNSNYVVYDGTGSSMTITSLSPSTQYMIIVYEYNRVEIFGQYYYYYRTTIGTGNTEGIYTLCTQPSTNASNLTAGSVSYTTANLSWTTGNSTYTLVALDNYSSGSNYYSPVDGSSYTPSSSWGSGSLLSGDNYVVYTSTGTSVNISNLLPARTYRATAFEFCGSSTGATWNYMTTSGDDVYFTTLNNTPTLNALSNVTRCQNSGAYNVSLSGITDGSTQESQTVTVSASSSNTTLIPNGNISISYSSPSSTGTLTFTPATNQYGSAVITVTANDGFSSNNTISRSFTVTVNPYPSAAGVISGTSTVCKNGSNYIYSVPAIANATGYVWSFPTGTVIVSGSNSNSITVNFPSSMSQSSGTVSVYGTNGNGCGNGTSNSKTIFFDATPTVSSAGTDAITCNGTLQLSGNNPSTGTGVWTVASGSANFNNASQNNTNVTGISSGQSVTLNWTISNGVCPNSVDQVVISFDPGAPACQIFSDFFASNTSPCVGASVNFTDNSVGATGWTWNFGGNATPNTSNSQNPTGIVFNSAGPQTITLTVTGPNGSDGETKNNYINVIASPSNAGAISGNTIVCEGDDQIIYSVGAIANATDYIWTIPSGSFLNSGSNTSSISIDYLPGSVSGTLSVQGQNSCGTGGISNLNITVNPLPGDAISVSGDDDICQGETGLTYSIGAIANATSYTWTTPNGISIDQDNGNSLVVDATTNAISGNFTVYASNSCGDGGLGFLYVNINPLPGSAGAISGITNITHCPITSGVLYTIDTVVNSTNYDWTLPTGATISGGNGADSILLDFGSNAVSGDLIVVPQNGCGDGASNSLSIVVDEQVSQSICLVTVDDNSENNMIVWEKNVTPVLSHYNVYREVTTGTYSLLAEIEKDSISMYIDTAVNPNTTSYKYKITAVDTCGNESEMSNHHSTIHLQFLGNGNLQWTLYEIENSLNPVDFYEVFRDDSSSGNWNSISSTIPGGNSTFTDVDYANFINPSYRVDVVWSLECNPSRAGVNTSRSNVRNAPSAMNGLNETAVLNNIKLFPNPSRSDIRITGINANTQMEVYNSIGQTVMSSVISNSSAIDVSGLPVGIYTVKVEWDKYVKMIKFIKE